MHLPSPIALLAIAIVILVLFGRGKVSSLMGEVGRGIAAFQSGLSASDQPGSSNQSSGIAPADPTHETSRES